MIGLPIKRPAYLAIVLLLGCGSSTGAPSSGAPSSGAGDDGSPGSGGGSGAPGGGDDRDATATDDSTDAGSGDKADADASSNRDGGIDGALDASTGPRPSAGCSGGAGAVSAPIGLTYAGTARSYDLHVPSGGPAGPHPLVLNLHGYTGSPAQQETLTAMNSLADSEGFLVAYPQGLGSTPDWNAGACCSAASEGDRDDLGFLNAVIDDVAAKACIDLARVYSMGFSNGGMMTYRLACQDSSRFAAAASVSGSAVVPLDGTCTPTHPMPLMHVHGNADPLVPYDGGAGGLPLSGRPTPIFPAAAAEVAAFRTKSACPSASTVYFDDGNAHCDHWGPCQGGSEVIFCTVDQGGHAWPGGTGAFSESSPLDATGQIWTFFKRHTLR
ncbi:MAG TPA: alpha/beta fold hydrolase [Polyangiaceae bacterium]|nr:alpha/beta fold hydrolase [Polyangiaceae bacterium]